MFRIAADEHADDLNENDLVCRPTWSVVCRREDLELSQMPHEPARRLAAGSSIMPAARITGKSCAAHRL